MIKKFILALLFIVIANGYIQNIDPGLQEFKTFKIDLNLPYKERFREVSLNMKSEIQEMYHTLKKLLPSEAKAFIQGIHFIMEYFYPEQTQEIQGIAEVVEIDYIDLLTFNFIIEFQSFCTSFVGRQDDGTIFLQRNVDFYHPHVLRRSIYLAQFYKGQRYLFDGTVVAGTVGVYTGFKNNSFALSMNQRYPTNSTINYLINLSYMIMSFEQPSWLIRDTLYNCYDYQCAFKMMRDSSTIDPFYIILAGLKENEGAVITRDRLGPANIQELSNKKNHIFWTNEDIYIGQCNDRCQGGLKILNQSIKDRITIDVIQNELMLAYPVLNEWAVYHTLMVPSKGIFQNLPISSDKKIEIY